MTTIKHRPYYSQDEIEKLYPKNLELEFVQVLLRHGERSPVSARFQNAGLTPYWPYCHAAQRMRSVVYAPDDVSKWNSLQWRRRLERFGDDDGPIIASGPGSEVDGICQLGELTDRGRETTYDLGVRLRQLYIHQLNFMPALISDADMIYLRATPIPRALESVQQTFWGMYPSTARTASFPPPTIISRTPADETLFPNEGNCKRFGQLARAFAQRAADRWNETEDMQYLSNKLTKWMPENKKVAVDSHPRLSGIMDTVNSTLAHGPETRLPDEFYDTKSRKIIERIGTEEWFAGYLENREYRTLGIGGLAGDIVERMTAVLDGSGLSMGEIGGEDGQLGKGRGGETAVKFAMSGCHDTTLAALLAAVGAYEIGKWPPYTSHIAVEMFKSKDNNTGSSNTATVPTTTQNVSDTANFTASKPGWLASMLGLGSGSEAKQPAKILTESKPSDTIGRKPFTQLATKQKSQFDGHYVRLRYNDVPVTIPACREPGNHLEGDESFCTLAAFKRVVDGFTPKSWKGQCASNLGGEIVGVNGNGNVKQPAGVIEEGF